MRNNGAFRSFDYVRTLFGIFAKPYESFTARAIAKEQIVRSAAVIAATIDSLEAANAQAAEYAREFAQFVASAHDGYLESLRGLGETSVSNVTFVKDFAAKGSSLKLPLPSVN